MACCHGADHTHVFPKFRPNRARFVVGDDDDKGMISGDAGDWQRPRNVVGQINPIYCPDRARLVDVELRASSGLEAQAMSAERDLNEREGVVGEREGGRGRA